MHILEKEGHKHLLKDIYIIICVISRDEIFLFVKFLLLIFLFFFILFAVFLHCSLSALLLTFWNLVFVCLFQFLLSNSILLLLLSLFVSCECKEKIISMVRCLNLQLLRLTSTETDLQGTAQGVLKIVQTPCHSWQLGHQLH